MSLAAQGSVLIMLQTFSPQPEQYHTDTHEVTFSVYNCPPCEGQILQIRNLYN